MSPVSAGSGAVLGWRTSGGAWPRSLALLALLMAGIVLMFRDTATAMVGIWWRSETFNHCFIILPVALWLAWRKRARLATLPVRPAPLVLLPAALAGVGWLMGDLTAVNAVTQTALVTLLVLAVPAILGWRVARELMFPLAFSYLAVPIGEFALPFMMQNTADFTVGALQLTGIPVYREGLHFVIPSGSWSVVEACSGVRYLIASFTVGLLFAHLNYRSWARRLIFVAVSIAVPVVANWLRAYMIVMLGHVSGNTIATGVDHLIYGWLFFGVVIVVMFAIGARWSEDVDSDLAPVSVAGTVVRGAAPQVATAMAFALAAAIGPLGQAWVLGRESARPIDIELPSRAREWRRTDVPVTSWRPAYADPTAQVTATYVRDEMQVSVYVGYYRNQDYERKLVSSSNTLVGSEDKAWARVAEATVESQVAERPLRWRSAELRALAGGGERLIVWHAYWIDDHWETVDAYAKLRTAWARLAGTGDDSAVVMLFTRKDVPGGAERALAAFAVDAGAEVERALRRARSGR